MKKFIALSLLAFAACAKPALAGSTTVTTQPTISIISHSTATLQAGCTISVSLARIDNLISSGPAVIQIQNGWLNVKNPPYNATGNGVTDDTNAIKKAIQTASPITSTNTCGTVYFPVGTYLVSDQIPWPSCTNLIGENQYQTTILASTGFPAFSGIVRVLTSTGAFYGLTTATFANKGTVRNFTIDGSLAPNLDTIYGLMLDQMNYGLAENMRVMNVPGYGIYVAGADTADRQYYTTIRHVVLDNNGRSATGNDQLGGAFLYGSFYDDINCQHSNGTCTDNDSSVSGVWQNILSTNSHFNTVGSGQIWADFGMQDSVIQNCRVFGGTIHLFGDGTASGVPFNDLILGNYVESGNGEILIGSADTTHWSTGNRIIGNTCNLSSGTAITVQYSSGTVVSNNIVNSWATGTGQTSAAIDVLGRNYVVTGNGGISGNSTVWLNENYNLNGLGEENVIANNNFPGSTMSLGSTLPLSSITNYNGTTTTAAGIWQFSNNVVTGSDIYAVPLTDYSGVSTIVGFSSFSTKILQYKKVGKTVTVYFYLVGTGNNIATTFTLPFTMNANVADLLNTDYAIDNGGTPTPGVWIMFANSATVTLYPTAAGGNWTASGARTLSGTIVYEAN